MEPSSPLLNVIHRLRDVLGLLPLRTLASLSTTCRVLRAAVEQLEEHPWLQRARHYPAWHPLLQAPSARVFLAQQAHAHGNLLHGRITQQDVTQQWVNVSPCVCVHQPWS